MEPSTIIFIAILAGLFLLLKWIITPLPPAANEWDEVERLRGSNNSHNRVRRPVTDSMIEVVQAVAPQLTRGQVKMDLERSGSVEVTINRYIEEGNLPYPPGESPDAQQFEEKKSEKVKDVNDNLIDRYGLSEKLDKEVVETGDNRWLSDSKERAKILNKRREEMILNARRRLATQLNNDLDL